jgi:catechol 2,3-dioxygenase-like lactoylglutathione lyase family enzyme
MTRFLYTMLRVTDLEKTRAFYEALGLEFRETTLEERQCMHESLR